MAISSTEINRKINYELQKVKLPKFMLSFPQLTPKQFQKKGQKPQGNFNWQFDAAFDASTDFNKALGKYKSLEEAMQNAITEALGPDKSKWPKSVFKTVKDKKTGQPKQVLNVKKPYTTEEDNEKIHDLLRDKIFLRCKRYAKKEDGTSPNKYPLQLWKKENGEVVKATPEDFYGGAICTAVVVVKVWLDQVETEVNGKTKKFDRVCFQLEAESICKIGSGKRLGGNVDTSAAYSDDEEEYDEEDNAENYESEENDSDDSGDEDDSY